MYRVARERKRKAPPQEDTLRARAERVVKRKTSFTWLLYSVGSFVLINALLIAIWAVSDSESPWFLWVLLIWAGALAFHIVGYVIGFRYGYSREAMIEDRMEEFRGKYGTSEPTQPDTTPEPTASEQEPPPRQP